MGSARRVPPRVVDSRSARLIGRGYAESSPRAADLDRVEAWRWQELFESCESAIGYEVRDLSVTAGGDVAFSHSLNRVSGTMKNGQNSDRWLRWTACYRKTNGKWLIVHEQVSVPICR